LLPKHLDSAALRTLELLTLKSRRSLLGITQGTHISLKRGHGIEFSDYWNLYARSDRMYVKTFNEEQNLAVYIVVDGSRSMRLPTGTDKWDFSSSVALALAYVALSQRDEVSIAVLGTGSFFRVNSMRGFHQIATLFSKPSGGEPDLSAEFRAFLARTRAPGILIFISDFLYPIETLEHIAVHTRSKNLDSTFIQTLSNFDCAPYRFRLGDIVDGETGTLASLPSPLPRDEYDELLTNHTEAVNELLNASNIRFVSQLTNEDPVTFIGSKLQEVGIVG
jgi:uncharacterized protein (DUF58 family)